MTLPNGLPGEMRIIAGDGIFAADPTRLLILSDQGRLLGRSVRYGFADIVCGSNQRCYGYDPVSDEIIEPDPSTFRPDGIEVPPLDAKGNDDLWTIEGDPDAFGVHVRPATLPERVVSEWRLLRQSPGSMAYGFGVGLLAAMLIHDVGRREKTSASGTVQRFLVLGLLSLALVVSILVGFVMEVVGKPLSAALPYLIAVVALAPSIVGSVVRRSRRLSA